MRLVSPQRPECGENQDSGDAEGCRSSNFVEASQMQLSRQVRQNTCPSRKNGLLCTLACGHCKGITCTNAAVNSEAELLDDLTA